MGKKKKRKKRRSNIAVVREKAEVYGVNVEVPKQRTLSPKEAGDVLGVTGEAIKQLIYKHQLPAARLSNRRWRVAADDLDTFIRKRQETERFKIIVAGKDLAALKQRQSALEELFHEVYLCQSKADALLKATCYGPSMIVIDMAKFRGGWTLAAKIRSLGTRRSAQIVMLAEREWTVNEVNRAMTLRIQACLSRKIDQETFKAEIKALLRQSKQGPKQQT